MKLIFLDTETTSLLSSKAKIWQFAASKYDIETNQTTNTEYYINVDKHSISYDALSKCNPNIEYIDRAPKFEVIAKYIAEFLELNSNETIYYVAHNAKFDRNILINEFKNTNINISKIENEMNWIDTLKIAQTKYQDETYNDIDGEHQQIKFSLSFLYYMYCNGLENNITEFHNANSDVEALKLLFKHLSQFYKIEDMVNISGKPVLLNKFKFGKHAGKLIDDVVHNDFQYIKWLVTNSDTLKPESENFDENLYYSINHYIKDL